MDPRQHHFLFAKQLIPTETFRSPDKMFAELTGPQREAFLMFLWKEAGKTMAQPLRHAEVARQPGTTMQSVVKLDVVGAVRQGWTEVVVISMPPALAPNEAIFIALVRQGNEVKIFFFERCRDQAGGVSETDAALAGVTADGARTNHGFFKGDGLETFKAELGRILNVSLAGLETSLPPVTMAAFMGAPGGGGLGMAPFNPGPTAGENPTGKALETMLLIRAVLPVFFYLIGWIARGVLGFIPLAISSLLTFGIIVTLAVWLYSLFNARQGKTSFSPGMAAGAWFIPAANFVLGPLVLRDAWRAVRGPEGSAVVFLWAPFWFAEVSFRLFYSFNGSGRLFMALGKDVAMPLLTVLGLFSTVVGVATYGLLWHIVRKINEKA